MRSAPRCFPQSVSALRNVAHGRVGRKDRRDSWGGISEQARPVGDMRVVRGEMQYTGRGQRFLNHREFVFNSHEETLLCIVAREP